MTGESSTGIARHRDALSQTIGRRPVTTYVVLTIAISWGGVLAVVGPANVPGTSQQVERLFPLALLALLAGPALAGILLTGLLHGRAGLRALVATIFVWRVQSRWYVIAVGTIPVLVLSILFVLSRFSPVFLPEIVTTDEVGTLLLSGLAAGLMGGILEELGWTGFAVEKLRLQYGVVSTGMIVGLVWGLWHVPITLWASGTPAGEIAWHLFGPPLFFYFGVLPVYRVLMVLVYDRTESLFVAMLMHAVLTTCTVVVLLPPATGQALIAYYVVLTAVLWIVTGILVASDGGHRSWLPIRGRMT